MSQIDPTLFAWFVTVKSKPEWGQTINARTAGAAKAEYHRDLREAWPDIPFTELRCQRIGAPHSSGDFLRNANYRGLPNIRCGDKVLVGDAGGVIVGHDMSCNFRVLFDVGTKYANQTLSVHPSELQIQEKSSA